MLQFTETDTLKPVTEHTNCVRAPSFRVMGTQKTVSYEVQPTNDQECGKKGTREL
jgi:hypothetical protein